MGMIQRVRNAVTRRGNQAIVQAGDNEDAKEVTVKRRIGFVIETERTTKKATRRRRRKATRRSKE